MKPIQAGDHAEIIEGALGTKGPNVGKKVRVVCLRGEHSEHGRIWKVEGEGLISEYGAVGSTVDCAQSWLRKIEPPEERSESSVKKEVDMPLTNSLLVGASAGSDILTYANTQCFLRPCASLS